VNLPNLLEDVVKNLKTIAISLKDKKKVVVMPSEESQSWVETVDVLNNKKLLTDYKKAQKEINKGLLVSEADPEEYFVR